MPTDTFDLAVIGGGINGVGIARDAAGRGLKVFLCEQGDLAGGTSSKSSNLIHGGLRYLEQREFRLVRMSLREREILMRSAPHLIKPLRFVLPHRADMRPVWMIRAGLFLYDHLGGRALSSSRRVDLAAHHRDAKLKTKFTVGFAYTDCVTFDARLTVTVAKDARARGATIKTRTRCTAIARTASHWQLTLHDAPSVRAKTLVNASGAWSERFPTASAHPHRVKLVQGSHLVVKKWYAGAHGYLLQNDDRRVVFVIPFASDCAGDLALIGTTEKEFTGNTGSGSGTSPADARITVAESDYLLKVVRDYFDVRVTAADIVHSFSGVRALYDPVSVHGASDGADGGDGNDGADGNDNADDDDADELREISRDYVVQLDASAAPAVTLYGGKLTTFRRASEAVLAELAPCLPAMQPPWTADATLPGGGDLTDADLAAEHPTLPAALRARWLNAYGSDTRDLLAGVGGVTDLGEHFGHGLYEREVAWLIKNEWATTADDILWRRSKLGLVFDAAQTTALEHRLAGG